MIWIQQHAELLFCLVGCMLVTVIPRVGPVMYLHAESLPDLLRHWLSFVPVAVMAALLGPGAGGAVRYAVMVLFAGAVWPITFAPLRRLLEKRRG